ncbi:MAG: hypothetical protein LBH82_04280 [Bacteroidales bacterium]|jgi:outer membrane protein assembly factor BamD (BamD/ComL family)|nr:hypothetical protein [Bacteroidales bacterium]
MKMWKNSTAIMAGVLVAWAFASCSTSKDQLNKQIAKAEQEIAQQYDTTKMNELITLYRDYVKRFPTDSLSGEYLFRWATTDMVLGKGADALRDFANLINLFPQHRLLPEAYYYKAHIYENIMYDLSMAKMAYYDFLTRFPEHKLAKDATLSIQYLGKSADEIIAFFEQTYSDTAQPIQ